MFETETLIKDSREAAEYEDEAIMILNHKRALDYILESKEQFKTLKSTQVLAVHSLLVKDLDIRMTLSILVQNYRHELSAIR